jgi:hypothetical protein
VGTGEGWLTTVADVVSQVNAEFFEIGADALVGGVGVCVGVGAFSEGFDGLDDALKSDDVVKIFVGAVFGSLAKRKGTFFHVLRAWERIKLAEHFGHAVSRKYGWTVNNPAVTYVDER